MSGQTTDESMSIKPPGLPRSRSDFAICEPAEFLCPSCDDKWRWADEAKSEAVCLECGRSFRVVSIAKYPDMKGSPDA